MEPPKINPDSVITSCVTELRRAVINLELAWRGGHLTSALHDLEAACPGVEKVIDVYQSLVTLQYPQHSAAREANLSSILESFEHMLKTPQRWFRAVEAVPSDSPSTGVAFSGIDVDSSAPPSIREISAQGPDGPVSMRIDQVLASRIWGVGFHFESQELAQFVDDALLRKAVNVLTARLRALQKIDLEWRKPAKADVPILFSGAGRLFEDLMVDILNQESLIARRAPLEEDFREKTDLRVYAPGLKRKRGARVQVTQKLPTW